jgi:hypothetical protein
MIIFGLCCGGIMNSMIGKGRVFEEILTLRKGVCTLRDRLSTYNV